MGYTQCTATSKRTHERCKARAVTGKKVCYHHGGAPGSGSKGGRTYSTHNLYSKTLEDDPELLAAYEYFKTNPDLLDMTPEIALAQAYFHKWLKQRPAGAGLSADYIGVVGEYTEKLSKLKEKEHKRKVGETINVKIEEAESYVAEQFATLRADLDAALSQVCPDQAAEVWRVFEARRAK